MNTRHFRTVAVFQVFLCFVLIVILQSFGFSIERLPTGNGETTVYPLIATAPDDDLGPHEEIKREIEGIVREIHLTDGKFLKGITDIIVSKEDIDFLVEGGLGCEGHLLGVLANDTIILKESGIETNRKTLYHEVGHNVWKQLSKEVQGSWPFMAPFVSDYATLDPEEDFAESFSCLMTNFDGCIDRLPSEKKLFLEEI